MKLKDAITETDIRFWIQLGTLVAGIAVGWALLSARVSTNEKGLVAISKAVDIQREDFLITQEKNNEKLLDIQIRLAEIQKDILYIRGQVK